MTFFCNKNKIKIVLVLGFFALLFLTPINAAHAMEPFDFIGFAADAAVNTLLKPFLSIWLKFAGFIFILASALFAWIVDPNNITSILTNPAVYEVWKTVRDFMNIFFILVLMYSAFSTIFQLKTYNIRNVILNLVIMALFVNFSFPIARVIIDITNVIMYGILNNIFVGDPKNIGSTLGALSDVTKLLMPGGNLDGENGAMYMMVAIVFLFLLAITMLVIAILLLIRMVVLAILVMLAPVGFVGNIFPSGKLKSYADDWWENMIKYAFSGPIMVFFVAISIRLMLAIQQYDASTGASLYTAVQNTPNQVQANFLSKAAFIISPIVVLWVGLGAAAKSGVAGGAMVGQWGQNMAKKFSGYNKAKKNLEDYRKVREARRNDKESVGTKLGTGLNNKIDKFQSQYALREKERKKALIRHEQRVGDKNKKNVKVESDALDHETEKNLFHHGDRGVLNSSGKTADDISKMSTQELHERAGYIMQFQQRGADGEREMMEHLKKRADAPKVDEIDWDKVPKSDIARLREVERKQKDTRDKWLNDEKAKILEGQRVVLRAAEDRKKIKQRPDTREGRESSTDSSGISGSGGSGDSGTGSAPPSPVPAALPTPTPTPTPTYDRNAERNDGQFDVVHQENNREQVLDSENFSDHSTSAAPTTPSSSPTPKPSGSGPKRNNGQYDVVRGKNNNQAILDSEYVPPSSSGSAPKKQRKKAPSAAPSSGSSSANQDSHGNEVIPQSRKDEHVLDAENAPHYREDSLPVQSQNRQQVSDAENAPHYREDSTPVQGQNNQEILDSERF